MNKRIFKLLISLSYLAIIIGIVTGLIGAFIKIVYENDYWAALAALALALLISLIPLFIISCIQYIKYGSYNPKFFFNKVD